MAPTPVFSPRKFHGRRSLADYSSWGREESDTTDQLSAHTHKATNIPKNFKYSHKDSVTSFNNKSFQSLIKLFWTIRKKKIPTSQNTLYDVSIALIRVPPQKIIYESIYKYFKMLNNSK